MTTADLFLHILWPLAIASTLFLYWRIKPLPLPVTEGPIDTSPDVLPDPSLQERMWFDLGERIDRLCTLELSPESQKQQLFEQLSSLPPVMTLWAGFTNKEGAIDPFYVYDETEPGFLTEHYGVRHAAAIDEAENPTEYAFVSAQPHLFSNALEAPMDTAWQKRLRYAPLVSVLSIPLFSPDRARPEGIVTLYTDTACMDNDILTYLTNLLNRFMAFSHQNALYHRVLAQYNTVHSASRFYAQLINAAPIRICWKNSDLVYLGGNLSFAKDVRLGKPDALKGKTDHDLFGAEEARLFEMSDRKVLEHGTELLNRIEKQGEMWRLSSRAPLSDPNGRIVGVVIAYIDYTFQYRAQNYHETTEQRFRSLLDQMPTVAIQGFDEQRHINYWNRQSEALYGYSAEEALGRKIDELILPRSQQNHFAAGIAAWLNHNDAMGAEEHTVLARSGISIPVQSARILLDRATENPQFYAIDIDLSLQKAAESKLKQLADYDALTMLPNRHHLNYHLQSLITRAQRAEKQFAIFFIDLDNFKYINDTFGHNYGDKLLVQAARRLQHVLRESDYIARFGGDEFIVTVEYGEDHFVTSHIAQKMISVLQEGFNIKEQELYVGASIGITLFPENSSALDVLLKQADAAMYKAKRGGKNQFTYFTAEMTEEIERQLTMENALRQTFQDDKITFFYQPQVDLHTGVIVSCEALVRWYDEENSAYIPPITFLPIVEKAHLMQTLTQRAFEHAVRLLDQWRRLRLALIRIDVNVPAEQLANKEILTYVVHLLETYNIDPVFIGIEITEGQLIDLDTEAAKSVLGAFSDLGIHISIDDFGTGYSSLSYLSRLTIDTVKIDKSFVQEYESSQNQALIRSIIAMAHELGYQVVAEGVELPEQADALKKYRCDKVQGNHFYLPKHAEAMTRELTLNLHRHRKNLTK
ncbi:EAL domain-containing protein [Sulfurimonas diazotrophicus]|uniref:EAL domain-containing protein n=1 Tax=Sulfurimonas diazotrophicus TaxID=3131939 RepID=A0ABZ3HC74_9BACT